MKDKTYRVTPHADGWSVKRDGAQRAAAVYDTKAEAVARAKEIARPRELQVVVHGQNGQIQTEYTYGHDPYPPKG